MLINATTSAPARNAITQSIAEAPLGFRPRTMTATDVESLARDIALTRFQSEALVLKDGLIEVAELMDAASVRRPRSVRVISKSPIELGSGTPSATVLRSVEQVNATPTSFSPFGPTFDGSSTALPTLGGIYDGSNGVSTLVFEVRKGGTHGSANLKIEISLQGGPKLQNINIGKSDPIDQQHVLDNGLIFSLGAGDLSTNDAFTVDVSDTVGSAVEPGNPMNGIRNDSANLQFGLEVTDGSFEVNGFEISVDASESLTDVLDRISNSGAGVIASFDAQTETVVLTQQSLGSEHGITVANDSSGFLAAVKLDQAVAVPGGDGDQNSVLALIPAFSGLTSGTLLVNEVAVNIDVNVDTLADVLDRINQLDTGVNAALVNDRVLIRSNTRSEPISLDDGDTGFFEALHIDPGIFRPREGHSVSARRVNAIADAMQRATNALNRVFELESDRAGITLVSFRKALSEAVERSFEPRPARLRFELGVQFDFGSVGQIATFGAQERTLLAQSLFRRFEETRNFFLGDLDKQFSGLLGRMINVLDQSLITVGGQLNRRASLVDLFA